MNRNEILQRAASMAGCTEQQVTAVLTSLAGLAASEIQQGFLLPEFGHLRVVPGPQREIRNPATGQTIMVPGEPFVEFAPDSGFETALLAQPEKGSEMPQLTEVETLPEIRLEMNSADLGMLGIEADPDFSNVNKLGGTPDWIQGPPECITCCATPMTFYGQLDSDFDTRFNIVDAGRIFVFLCRSCAKSISIVQYF